MVPSMKKSSKRVIHEIQQQQLAQKKSNYTFRLADETMARLRAKCTKNDISMASVVEALIQDFVSET
jgi:hypothetical protein